MNTTFHVSSGGGFGGLPILIFIAVAALIIVGAIFSWMNAKKRREALAAWAASKGLSFTEGRDGVCFRVACSGASRKLGEYR